MARDDGFLEHLHDLLDPLGSVVTRGMFGGHGVYIDERFVAIVIDGRLYLKVDAETQARFEAAGSEPFVYMGRGEAVTMSYWSAPEAAMEAAEEMALWARLAIDAAGRKPAKKPRSAKSAEKRATKEPVKTPAQRATKKPAKTPAKKPAKQPAKKPATPARTPSRHR